MNEGIIKRIELLLSPLIHSWKVIVSLLNARIFRRKSAYTDLYSVTDLQKVVQIESMFHYFRSRRRPPLCSYLLSLYVYVHIMTTPRIVAIFSVETLVLTYDNVSVLIRQT